MQLYALNDSKNSVLASEAKKGSNYFCCECGRVVRVKKGFFKQPHFFHLSPSSKCRQTQKSLTHILLQQKLLGIIPKGEATMERQFPKIHRIADVAWDNNKIIFEIQCSPISLEEVNERNRDYESEGYRVVWILHERRFNKKVLSAAEALIRPKGAYFTNFSPKNGGDIYDQWERFCGAVRTHRGPPLIVDLSKPLFLETGELSFKGSFRTGPETIEHVQDHNWTKEPLLSSMIELSKRCGRFILDLLLKSLSA